MKIILTIVSILSLSAFAAIETEPTIYIDTIEPQSEYLDAGTKSVYLKLETAEEAKCNFSKENKPWHKMYAHMNANGNGLEPVNYIKKHKALVSVDPYSGKTYTYYVHCMDKAGNKTISPAVIQFAISKE